MIPHQSHKKGRSGGKSKTEKSQAHISNVKGMSKGAQPGAKRTGRPAGTPVVASGGRTGRQKVK